MWSFFCTERKFQSCTHTRQTELFIAFMQKLISAMISRVSSSALGKSFEVLRNALDCINRWEANTGPTKAGFLSRSIADGLRVTLKGTVELLQYLRECVGYKYLLTSRLSRDAIKKLFGIIRQFSQRPPYLISFPNSKLFVT